jgi:hypothetical protein
MKKHWRTIAVILLIAAVLTFFLRGLMRENVVEPLIYLFWVGQLILWSTPQFALWAIFVFVALLVALRSLIKEKPPQAETSPAVNTRNRRIGNWVESIQRTEEDSYYQWQLALQLQKLTVQTLALDERAEPKEIRMRLSQGTLTDMPPEIMAYLQAGLTSFSHFVEEKSRFGFKLKKQASPLDIDPAQVIEYLEDKIEHHSE